ncbi:MAG: peptidylprolyl isomerase [Nitrospirae bacterium]|nr:peptidylprolyl isomerase [Nitrospirota bacterium]
MVSGRNGRGARKILYFFAAAVIAFIFSTGSTYASPLLDRVVAVVNKEVITWSELYKAMEFEVMSGEMKSMSDADKKKLFKESEATFLEGMIDKKLQLQAAKRLDIDAGKEEISDAIEGIKKKYSMDDKEFQESLKKEGFSFDEYKKRLAEHIILSKVVGQQVRSKVVVTDEEVKQYMAKNADTEYRVRQIFFRKPEKDADRSAVEARAQEVFQKVKGGEDFAATALKYSEDPTGRVGGDLGFIKKELLGKEFLDVISQMSVGDVGRPFWTARGLHIIKLEEKVDARNMDEFKESVKKKLFEKKFDEEYRNWIRGLREKAFVEVRL